MSSKRIKSILHKGDTDRVPSYLGVFTASDVVPELVEQVIKDILQGVKKNEIVQKLARTKESYSFPARTNCPEDIYQEALGRVKLARLSEEERVNKVEQQAREELQRIQYGQQ